MRMVAASLRKLGPLTLALLGACGTAGVGDGACPPAPLTVYCKGMTCPSYGQAEESTRKEAQRLLNAKGSGGMICMEAFLGTCGDLRVVSLFNGLYGPREYYTQSGELVGAVYQTDVGDCLELRYGEVPECEMVSEVDLCK